MRIAPVLSEVPPTICAACANCPCESCAFRVLPVSPVRQRAQFLRRGDRLESRGGKGCLQFWIVVEGTAASCTSFSDGRRQIVGLERSGDVICAQMAGSGSANWLEALSDCQVCELDLTPLADQLRGDSAFLAASFRIAHRRLARAQAHVSTLGRLDSRERVLLFLGEMAAQSENGVVALPMSREDIADYLGLNTETVSRILGRIKRSGLVRFLTPTEYVVPDLDALAARLPVAIPKMEMHP